MAITSKADEKNSIFEWPDGATRVARDTHWASRADGHPDGCPMEGGWVPVGGGQVPDGRGDGYPTEGGSRGVAQRWVSGVA
jgi:hypothetical protein